MESSIVILTGAGISAESGLGTFRSRDGIWARYDLRRVATPEAFAADPGMVHEFYNLRRQACADAAPHAGHRAIARLQQEWPGPFHLITQNVDDLHERAGSSEVIHMHGRLGQAICAACGHRWPAPARMGAADPCPACGRPATRPDVVWFGEEPQHMPRIMQIAAAADIFAVIGSSGVVWPAAGLAQIARRNGATTWEVNLQPTGHGAFDKALYGPASIVLPGWVDGLLAAA